ncbi:MAG: glycoside hydrolase family 88 protein [Bacteroidales bacterium]
MKPNANISVCAVVLVFTFFIFSTEAKSISMPGLYSDSLKWADKMVITVMNVYPEAWQIDDRKEPRWDYVHGLVLTSMENYYKKNRKPEYLKYIKDYADEFIDSLGNINTYKADDYNLDMINAGKILFLLYDETHEQKYLIAMQHLRNQLDNQPRTSGGGFWHKKRYPNQMWLDGLYMSAPFYARYTVEFENGKKLDDVITQFRLIQKHLYDRKTGLYFHGWDESKQMGWANKKTGCSPSFWSRSIGWYAMALVDVLDYIPENHPGKKELIGYLNKLAGALVKFQDKSGLWFQVTDQGKRQGNYLETTGSAMYAYAFAKAVNKGYLPANYKAISNKAFDGLITLMVKTDPNGNLILGNCCAVAGLGGNPYRDGSYNYYINEKRKDNDPKGIGPFILAGLELDR